MASSILNSVYIEPTRPYSQKELQNMRLELFKELKLSETQAFHKKCKHSYFVKSNGKKEQDIKENDIHGNCSVCWKFNKTDSNLKNRASNLIEVYIKYVKEPQSEYTFDIYDLEMVFYKWLYKD
jgi:hypothetical protein